MTSLPVLDSAHFTALVARLPVGIAVYRLDDPDDAASLRLIYGNARAEAITGLRAEEEVGKTIGELSPILFETDRADLYAEVVRTGEERDLGEVEYSDERIGRRTLALRAFPLPDRCVGIEFEDVSDQKELRLLRTMREALETSEERLRLATSSAAIGTWDFDPVSGRLAWDDRCKAIYGLAPDDYVDYGVFLGRIHPDDRGRTDEAVQRALEPAGAVRYDVEYRIVRPEDRSERWVHATGKSLFEGQGGARRAVRFIGTARDVTEEKQAEVGLEQAQRDLRETNRHLEARVAERTARLEAFADDLKQLHRLTTAEHDDRAALVRSFLEAGCTMFGLPVGALGTLVEEGGARRYAVEAVVGTETELQPGSLVPVETLFVSAVLAREDTVAIEDAAGDDAWRSHPAYTERGYRTFLGTPVWLEDRLYGAVHFLGHEPPPGGLAPQDRELIEVLAEMIGRTLRLEQVRQARATDDRLYRSLVETVSDAILLVDADSRILMSNPAAGEMLGIDPEPPLKRLTGEHRWPVFDEAGRPISEEELPERQALRTGEAVNGAVKGVRRPDGATAWFSVNVRPLDLDEDGVPEAVVASFNDITAQRNAVAALEHKTRQLEDAQALAHLGYWHYDVASDAVHWSDELYAIFGVDPEEAVTFERYTGLLHPEDREQVEAVVGASMQSGAPYEVSHRIVRPDGTVRWIHSYGEAVVDEAGRPIRLQGTAQDVTERIEAQRAIEALTRRLERILDAAGEGIYGLDREGRTTFVNRAAAEMLGYEAEELIGEHQHDLLHHTRTDGTPYPREDCPIYAVLRDGRERRVTDEVFWRKDGSGFPVEYVSSPIREDGRITGAVVVFQDVTEPRRVQEAIRVSETRLRTLTDTAVEGIVTAGKDGRIVDWNQGAENIFGYTKDEAVGAALELLMPERFKERHREGMARYLRTGEARVIGQTVELVGRRKDGTEFPLDLSLTVWTMGGEPFFTAILRDVTERREAQGRLERYAAELEAAQNELQANAAFLQSTLDALSAHVAILDEEGTIVAVNEAWRRFADENGYEGDDAGLGSNYLAASTIAGSEDIADGIRRLLAGEADEFTAEYPCHGPDEQRWFLLRVTRFASPEGVRLVTAHENVTEMKRAQQVLQQNAADLAERNEELQQFAYVASHDLQEPLRMVTSFLQLLERRYTDALDETARQYIEFAVDGARRMQALIKDLLAYSRIGTHGHGFVPVDMNGVLETAVRDLGPALEDVGGRVEAGDLPTVTGDATQLHQLILNLIGNAVKFRRPDASPRLRIAAAPATVHGRPGWRFTVADNGIGIEPQYADRIFQVFQRLHTREEYEGTGIGLAISKKIVERHGGEIGFEPTPGGGTTFYFTLPSVPPSSIPLT